MNLGLYAIGELLQFETRPSNDGSKVYNNVSVLIGTTIKQFNVPAEKVGQVAPIQPRSKVKIAFTEFVGRNFTSSNLVSIECLK